MSRGSAVMENNTVFLTPSGSESVYSYQLDKDRWQTLPSAPYRDSALIILDGELVAIGGEDDLSWVTNKVFILRQKKWRADHDIPPMNVARSSPAVAKIYIYILSIGGNLDYGRSRTVELFHMRNRTWSKLNDFPGYLLLPMATLCGEQLYVASSGYSDNVAYTCSLNDLFTDYKSPEELPTLTWSPLQNVPISDCTAASLCGYMVLVGGKESVTIFQLVDGYWLRIGSLSDCRSRCLAVSVSRNKIVVIGSYHPPLQSIEIITAE